jgi:uncharacterized protein
VRFWDSSAVVPLLVGEDSSAGLIKMLEDDPAMLVWWATPVECVSALARLERDGALDSPGVAEAVDRLDALELHWDEVQPVARLRSQAIRLLRVHPLRAADALQLAAAIVAAEDQPRTLTFLTLDDRLALAAQREGFSVVRPAA